VENLEWVNHSENCLHAFEHGLSKRKNKIPGVFYCKQRKKWASYIYRKGQNIFVGRFCNEEDAIRERELKLCSLNLK
jgi:hypothetical protein